LASTIDLRRLDHDSDVSEGGRIVSIDQLATGKVAISNAARRPRAGAFELATRRSLGAARLSWSGMRV
jgi:hypothetical protein